MPPAPRNTSCFKWICGLVFSVFNVMVAMSMNHAPVPGGATGLADILGLNHGESVINVGGASDGLSDIESEGLVEVRVEGAIEGE